MKKYKLSFINKMTDVNKNYDEKTPSCPMYPELSNVENILRGRYDRNPTREEKPVLARNQFINYVVDENMKKINKQMIKSEKKVDSLQKVSERLAFCGMWFNALGVGASTAGFGSALSGVGVVATIPLGAIAASSGLIGGICSAVSEKINKMMLKKIDRLKMIYEAKTKLNNTYLKCLRDDVIDDGEFRELSDLMYEFETNVLCKQNNRVLEGPIDNTARSANTSGKKNNDVKIY